MVLFPLLLQLSLPLLSFFISLFEKERMSGGRNRGRGTSGLYTEHGVLCRAQSHAPETMT